MIVMKNSVLNHVVLLKLLVIFFFIALLVPSLTQAKILNVHYAGDVSQVDYYHVFRNMYKVNQHHYFMGAAIADDGQLYIDILRYNQKDNDVTVIFRYDQFSPDLIIGRSDWIARSQLYTFQDALYYYTYNFDRAHELYIFREDKLVEIKKFSIRGNSTIPVIGEEPQLDAKKHNKVWQVTNITATQEFNGHLYFLVRRTSKYKHHQTYYFDRMNFLYRTDGSQWERIILPDDMRSGFLESMRILDGQLTIKKSGDPGKLFSANDGIFFSRNFSAQKLAKSFNSISFIGNSLIAIKGDRVKNYTNGRWKTVLHRRVNQPIISANSHFATIIPSPSYEHPGHNHWLTTNDGFTFYYFTFPIKHGVWSIEWSFEKDGYVGLHMVREDSSERKERMLLSKDGKIWRKLPFEDYFTIYTIDNDVVVSPFLPRPINVHDLPIMDVQHIQLPTWFNSKDK